MRIVHRHKPGHPFNELGWLSPADVAVLRRHRAGLARSQEEAHALRVRSGAIIAEIHRKGAWLACNCRASDAAVPPPILFPREAAPGVFTLSRSANRTEHDDACPFRWEEGELSGRSGGGGHVGRQSDTIPDFVLYKRTDPVAAEIDSDDILGGDAAQQGRRADSLQRRLFWLLTAAGINRFSAAPLDMRAECEAIRGAAMRITLAGRVRLSELLWISPDWLAKGWAAKRLARLREKDGWPSHLPLQGYFLITVSSIEGNRLIAAGDVAFDIEGAINVFAGDTPARAPYVALVSARLDEEIGAIRLMRAYVHPRYAVPQYREWSLFPVDSDYEREAASALRYVAKRAAADTNGMLSIVVEKPLHDLYPDDATEGCRPDFIIRAGDRACVVETMGSGDPSYRSRKQRMHSVMARIGPVLEDERVNVPAEQANRRLIARVFGWLRVTEALMTAGRE